jgi:hypothetical protein
LDNWQGWEAGRVVLILVAVLYLGIWVQLTLYHWRAAFRRREMWFPVFWTPVIAVGGLLGVIDGDGVLGWIAVVAFAFGIFEGLAGLFFHLQGTRYMLGGITLRNLMGGPPPLLPVAYSLTGVFGLVVLLV